MTRAGSVVWIVRLYRCVARCCLPGPFMQRVGEGLLETFAEAFAAARLRGRRRAAGFAARAFLDLVVQALVERTAQLRGSEPYGGQVAITTRPTASRRAATARGRRAEMRPSQAFILDARFALRALRGSPTFTAVAIVTLALAIGANGAMFSLVNGVLLSPLPYSDSGRIVQLVGAARGEEMNRHSYPNFLDYAARNETIESLTPVQFWRATVHFDRPQRLQGLSVGAGYFETLRVTPYLGRFFQAADDLPGHENVAIVSYAFWRDRLDGDTNVVGRSLRLGDELYTVIGVTPETFEDPFTRAVFYRSTPAHFLSAARSGNWLSVIGRLAPGVTLAEARTELTTILDSLRGEYPDQIDELEIGVARLQDMMVGGTRGTLLILFGAVGAILLIGCANVAHFMLARASTRSREVAVRLALGGTRGRVARQLLTESLILSVLAGLVGLGLSLLLLRLAMTTAGSRIPRAEEVGLDLVSVLFVAAVSAVTGVAFGIVPSLRWGKTSLSMALRSATAGSGDRSGVRVRGLLVVAEVAVAVTLLTSAGLLLRSLDNLSRIDPGLEAQRLLSFNLQAGVEEHPEGEALIAFRRRLEEALAALPGVDGVGFTNALPLAGMQQGWSVTRDDRPLPPPSEQAQVQARAISSDFIETARIPLLEGRVFGSADGPTTQPVALASESMVRVLYAEAESPVSEALGKTVTLHDTSWLIVGVVGDVRENTVAERPKPALYTLASQGATPDWMRRWIGVIVRTGGDPAALAESVRRGVWSVDPSIAITSLRPMEALIARAMLAPWLRTFVLSGLSLLGLLAAAVGISAVIAHSVSCRVPEIAVRKALGADRFTITRQVVGEGVAMAGIGLVLGLAGSLLAARSVTAFLFEVGPYDLVTFSAVAVLLLIVAFLSSYFPARRAAGLSAVRAMRAE